MRPKRSMQACARRAGVAASERSAATKIVGVPNCESSAATASPRVLSRPVTTSPPAPERAKVSAMARPMPCVEPVTSTTLPSSLISIPPPGTKFLFF